VSNWLLLITCLAPLVGTALAFSRLAPLCAILAAFIALTAALAIPADSILELQWVLGGAQLALFDTDRWFLAAAGLIWGMAGLYAFFSVRGTAHASRFWFFFTLAMAGNFSLILGQDLMTFYLGFSVMGLASYGLIVHSGSESARYAGRVYLVMTLVGEFALFAGFILLYAGEGQVGNLPAQLLLLFAFGIKAGLFGLHMWLPLAHPAAPEPASAVLSGVMIKAALIGWMRYLPFGQETMHTVGAFLLILGLIGTVFATFVGLTQRDAKTVLAYSSIAKMGLMSAALGIAALEPTHAPIIVMAVAMFAVHHGVVKAALFLSVGIVKTVHKNWIWVTVIPVMAMIGLPFTSGASAKAALKDALAPAQSSWLIALEWGLMFATLATVLLMARFLVLLYGLSDVTRPSWRPTVIPCAVLCIATFALVPAIGVASVQTIDAGLLSLAVIISIYCFKFYPSMPGSIAIPAGDLIVSIGSLYNKITRFQWFNTSKISRLSLGRLDEIRGISMNPMFTALEKRIAQPGTSAALWFGFFLLILLVSVD
jgi:formate hydrogenlyase subunit 3/multisubunit Na+/H+ antiporter MnhD subunit